MKKCIFEFLDPGEGIWNCDCIIEYYNNIKVSNFSEGYKTYVEIIINDKIRILFEGDFIKKSLKEV